MLPRPFYLSLLLGIWSCASLPETLPPPPASEASSSSYPVIARLLDRGELEEAERLWKKVRHKLQPRKRELLAELGSGLWLERAQKAEDGGHFALALQALRRALLWNPASEELKKERNTLRQKWRERLLAELQRGIPKDVYRRIELFPKERPFWRRQIQLAKRRLERAHWQKKLRGQTWQALDQFWPEVKKLVPPFWPALAKEYWRGAKRLERQGLLTLAWEFSERALVLSPRLSELQKQWRNQLRKRRKIPLQVTFAPSVPLPVQSALLGQWMALPKFRLSRSAPWHLEVLSYRQKVKNVWKERVDEEEVLVEPSRPNPEREKLERKKQSLLHQLQSAEERLLQLQKKREELKDSWESGLRIPSGPYVKDSVVTQSTVYIPRKFTPAIRRRRRELVREWVELGREVERLKKYLLELRQRRQSLEDELWRTPSRLPAKYARRRRVSRQLCLLFSARMEVGLKFRGREIWRQEVRHVHTFPSEVDSEEAQLTFLDEMAERTGRLKATILQVVGEELRQRSQTVRQMGKETLAREYWLQYLWLTKED